MHELIQARTSQTRAQGLGLEQWFILSSSRVLLRRYPNILVQYIDCETVAEGAENSFKTMLRVVSNESRGVPGSNVLVS